MLKKLLISLLLSIFLLVNSLLPFFTTQAGAQAPTTWYNQNFTDWYDRVYNSGNETEVFGERYTAAQVQWVIYGLFAFFVNSSTDKDAIGCRTTKDNLARLAACERFLQRIKKILIADNINQPNLATRSSRFQNSFLGTLIETDRPLSGITYIKDNLTRFKLIPEANAQVQGFGYNAFTRIRDLWRTSRDVSYALVVFSVLVLAFMIMFRVKISPQVVITIQSALPKVVVALILITFSYAIAGFMVDLMYVAIGLMSFFMASAYSKLPIMQSSILGPMLKDVNNLFNFMTQGLPGIGLIGALFAYLGLFALLLGDVIFGLLGAIATGGLAGAAVVFSAILLALPGVNAILIFALVILFIIILLVLLWHCIRVIWMLFQAFANIVLLVVFAPIQIALGVVVPSLGFGQWFRSMAANLSVFVVTSLFIALGYYFMFVALDITFSPLLDDLRNQNWAEAARKILLGSASTNTQGWPPLLGNAAAGGSEAVVFLGVSFVLFTLLPKVSDIIKSIIEGKPFAYGAAIGESITGLPSTGLKVMGMASEVGKAWSSKLGTRNVPTAPQSPPQSRQRP